MAYTPIPSSFLDHPMSPAFSALFDQIEGRYDRSFLRRFFSFVSSCGVEPDDVDEAVLAGFAQAVLVAGVDRPKQVVRDAVRTWNRLGETVEGWPQRQLPLSDSRKWLALPMSAFPKSFSEDCEAYLHRSEGQGLFDERGSRKLSEATKIDRRHKLRQLATRLVKAGRAPSSIKRLADLVQRENAELILLPLWEKEGKNGHASNLVPIPTKPPVCNGMIAPRDSWMMPPLCNEMIPPGAPRLLA